MQQEPPRPAGSNAPSEARALGLAAGLLVVTVLLSRVLGFARDAFVAGAFGATGATDAFYAAFTIPDALNYLVAGGTLSITFIPLYAKYLARGEEDEGNRVFSIVATIMAAALCVAIVGLELAAPALVHAYLGRLDPADRALAITLTRILLPAQLFFYVGGLASATLFARRRFLAASLAPLVYNAGTIVGGVLLGRSLGVASLAWGTLGGAMIGPFLLQIVAARRAGLRVRPTFAARHPEFVRWLKLTLPLMIGVSLITADEWILKYFAAGDPGAISRLSYARKLVMVPIAIAGQAVGQASMPFFAKLHAEGRGKELGALVARSARATAVISALAAGAMIALAVPLVDVLFRRGQFDAAQVTPTALYLSIFAVAIPLWGMQGIVARAFYATGDTRTPMLAGTVVTVVSLPIYALAARLGGIAGLAVASDVGIALHTVALLVLLPRRVPDCARAEIGLGVGRAVLLASFAGGAAWAVARVIPSSPHAGTSIVRAVAGGLAFLVIVLLLARPLGVEDVGAILGRLRRRKT